MTNKLILASESPRRKQILEQIGIPFTVRSANIDENVIKVSHPEQKVKQLASLKSKAVPLLSENEVILAADTVVAQGNQVLGKPKDRAEAATMIETLSGNIHSVFTGVSIRSIEKEVVFAVETKVTFWQLTDKEMNWYIQTSEPYDKAGGYGIQGLAGVFIKKIDGDYYNVVGLPISYVVRKLPSFGISLFRS